MPVETEADWFNVLGDPAKPMLVATLDEALADTPWMSAATPATNAVASQGNCQS